MKTNPTLTELIDWFKYYSGKYVDTVTNHEVTLSDYYFSKICLCLDIGKRLYNVDLNDTDL